MPLPVALLAAIVDRMLTQSAFDASLQHDPRHVRGPGPNERDRMQQYTKYIWSEPSEIKEETIKLLIKKRKKLLLIKIIK